MNPSYRQLTKSLAMRKTTSGILFLFLSALLGGIAAASQNSDPTIPNPKIAEAVRTREIIKDDPTAVEELTEIILFIIEQDVWDNRDSYLAMMRHHDYFIRGVAVKSVSESTRRRDWKVPEDDPFGKVLLELVVNDPAMEVREEAVYALRNIKATSACGTLVQLRFADPPGNPKIMNPVTDRESYRWALSSVIEEMKCPGVVINRIEEVSLNLKEIIEIYAKADPSKFFGPDRTNDEWRADKYFNKLDPNQHLDEILRYLNHQNPVVRIRMAQALAESNKREALKPLIKMMESDPVIDVRETAIKSIGKLGERHVCHALEGLLGRTEFGSNFTNTRHYLTAEDIHKEILLTMQKLDCKTLQ